MIIKFLKNITVAKKDAILLTMSGILILISLFVNKDLSQFLTIILGSLTIFRGFYKWITSPKIKKQLENPLLKN